MPDVVVVGAGPAGLSAAIAAAQLGAKVTLIDDNPTTGGQIWRESHGKKPSASTQRLYDRLSKLEVTGKFGSTVVDVSDAKELILDAASGTESIKFDAVILCTGARELFLPFPGWTLPGVMGAGGAQALLKGGAQVEGKRVVVSGSGPLLLAVGASFASAGAEIIGIFEQASMAKMARFGAKALNPKRIVEAAGYLTAIGSAPYKLGTWVSAAFGEGSISSVEIADGSSRWIEPCDLLACAYGLVPNTELAELMGCVVRNGVVVTNENQETTIEGVFTAGEPLGIGGLDLSLAEGRLAGCIAAGGDSTTARSQVAKLKHFRALLTESFKLRPEIYALANSETVVCRCEDVRLGAIDRSWSSRQAKLYTRIGMGPCQGRICGPATRCLFGWDEDRTRPPLYPTEVNHLAALERAETL